MFELKKGMKVKNKFGNIHIFLELINGEYWFENRTCNLEEEIDWEATKKINEVKVNFLNLPALACLAFNVGS